MITIDQIIALKGVIKWNAVFIEARLNPNTMRSAIHNKRELRREEAVALMRTLSKHGVILDSRIQTSLFEGTTAKSVE